MPAPQARIAAAGGAVVFAGFVLMPGGLLEGFVLASGIPAVLAAAEPPLGFTARIGLGGLFGGIFAAFLYFGLQLLEGEGDLGKAILTRLRSRDAHPDAPRRAPLSILELGEPAPPPAPVAAKASPPPPPTPPVERALPADLDQPLAAFDPAAIPDEPLPPPVAVAPRAAAPVPPRPALIDPGDRFETFELTPVRRPSLRADPVPAAVPAVPAAAPANDRVVGPATEATVNELLARLERGLASAPAVQPTPLSGAPAPEPRLEPQPAPKPMPLPSLRTGRVLDALGDLRALAVAPR